MIIARLLGPVILFASLSVLFESLDPPSFWCNLSSNSGGSLCKLLRVEESIFISIWKMCGLIRQKIDKDETTIIILKDQCILFVIEYK